MLHDIQTEAIKISLKSESKIDPERLKQKISQQLTNDLLGKI